MVFESTPLARALYRLRWWSTLLVLGVVFAAVYSGTGRLARFNTSLQSLGDVSNGGDRTPPVVFDSRMDIWFGAEDEAVLTYHAIENRFVAEDYLVISFEDDETPFGVFSDQSLEAVARLTDALLAVPGVRHVRSLTSNPWIRWGQIDGALDENGEPEEGLLISDLVEGEARLLTAEQRIERMVAVLGAAKVAERVGEDAVRAALGPDTDFADHLGEPLLLGTIIDGSGSTTALQIQVLRPRVDGRSLEAAFGTDTEGKIVAPDLFSVVSQRSAMRGIEHALREELGQVRLTPAHQELSDWIQDMPPGDERSAKASELADPTRAFMADSRGELRRKWFEFAPNGDGSLVDQADPDQPHVAEADWTPQPKSPYRFHVGGSPYFERNFELVGMADAKYIGFMFAAIALLLALIFRNPLGVLAPMAVVVLSVAGMVGFVLAIGDLFNNMTMVSPNMLTAVGIADAIHLVAAWAALRHRSADKKAVLIEVLRRNALPVFLTSLTTTFGFLSLTVSEISPVRMLGYTAAIGTVLAWLLSMTVVPALLSLVPVPRDAGQENRRRVGENLWAGPLSQFLVRRRAAVLVVAGVAIILSAIGIARLEIDSDFRAMFPDSNPVMTDFRWIEARLGGVGDLEIVFEGPGAAPEPSPAEQQRLSDLRVAALGADQWPDEFDPLTTAEQGELSTLAEASAAWEGRRIGISSAFLTQLDAFETRLRSEMTDLASPLHIITDLNSPLDVLRKMHQVQNESRGAFYRVPDESDVPQELRGETLDYDEWTEEWRHVPGQSAASLVAQYYLQYENGARPGENLTTNLSANRTVFRMQGRVSQAPANLQNEAFTRIRQIAREEFPQLVLPGDDAVAQMTLSGKTLLFSRTNRIFTVGFLQSMSLALVMITLLIAFIFRSVRLALISLVPNVLPILLPISFFGLIGQPLDGPAVFVSSVALGVCVDDTIHFFTKFSRARAQGQNTVDALRTVFETVGSALTITSVVLMVGFGFLAFSDFTPNSRMGSLAVVMIGLAWVADFCMVPALLSLLPETKTPAPAASPTS